MFIGILIDFFQIVIYQKYNQGADDCSRIKAYPYSQANPGAGPQAGRCCQSLNLIPPGHHNCARAEETHTADNLSSHTGHIAGSIGDIPESVFSGHHNKGCPQAYKNMGFKSGSPLFYTPEKSDNTAADSCQQQSNHNNRNSKRMEIFIYCLKYFHVHFITTRLLLFIKLLHFSLLQRKLPYRPHFPG